MQRQLFGKYYSEEELGLTVIRAENIQFLGQVSDQATNSFSQLTKISSDELQQKAAADTERKRELGIAVSSNLDE